MPDPLSPKELEHFVGILERPEASDTLKQMAQHLVQLYFSESPQAAGDEWLRLRARNDVDAFSEYVFGFKPAVHHREMTRALNDERRKRTVVVAPPGAAKSHYVSLVYPTFMAAKYPDRAAMILTETADQAERFSSQIRPLLEGANAPGRRLLEVFPEVVPDKDAGWTRQNLYLANRTKVFKEPNLFFSAVGSSSIQGARADLQLYDDIIGPKVVRSPTEMHKVREDLRNLLIPRLLPDGRILVVMTRWSASDLLEQFITEFGFEVIHMPALADDPRGAYSDFIPTKSHLRHPEEGERGTLPQWVKHPDGDAYVEQQLKEAEAEALAEGFQCEITTSHPNFDLPCLRKYLHKDDSNPVLWPEWFDKEALGEKRQANPVSFRLVYNGDPTGISGDIFKREWFRTYGGEDDAFKTVPVDSRIFMSVDLAAGGKGTRTDYFVILVVAVDQYGNKFIIDCYRDKILFPQQRDKLISMYKDLYPQTQAIVIEATNYQAALPDELATHGLPVISVKPIKKKELRIESSSVYWQQGKVFLPHNAPWKDAFVDEHTQFPRGKHDDQIDAGAQLFEFLSTYRTMPEEMTIGFG